MNLLSKELEEALLGKNYKTLSESLKKQITDLEARIEQLERALELYRKGAQRGSTEEDVAHITR